MSELLNFFLETFRRFSGRVMRPAGAPPSKSSTPTIARSTFRGASSLDTTHWTKSRGNYARPIRTLSIRTMERPRPCTTGELLRGARGRKASPPEYTGLDVVVVRDSKIAALYVFLNPKLS